MRTPPGLLGLALLFWGWRIEALWLAVPMAVMLEGSRRVSVRFEFSQDDLDRIWTLCILLFAGAAAVTFAAGDGLGAIGSVVGANSPAERMEKFNAGATAALRFLQFAPATLLPIVLAQAFARQERFPGSTFSSWLRARRRSGRTAPTGPEAALNVSHPFLAVVLFSASLTRADGPWFLAGLTVLVLWALWGHRRRSAGIVAWGGALVVAMVVGVLMLFGLIRAQHLFRDLDSAIIARLGGSGQGYNPKGTRTSIGTIGGLKQSGQILLRVEADGAPPGLLREASYDSFRTPAWTSSRRHFERTLPDGPDSSWSLVPQAGGTSSVAISMYLDGGRGLLPLPTGTERIVELPVFLLQTNGHGAVQAEEGPGFVRFTARHGESRTADPPPNLEDGEVPIEERAAIRRVADELELVGLAPEEAIARIRRYFANRFEYATWRGAAHRADSNRTALAAFLLEHRSGHCEYFATATTLLLRVAKIPARYAVGYAVQEKKGPYHLVRGRHAHAWALAWMNGRWQDVDTTPGSWFASEAGRAGFWEPLSDVLSRVWFEFSKWRWGPTDWKRHIVWLIVPLVLIVAMRVVVRKQWRRTSATASSATNVARLGLDSELFQIERRLAGMGCLRAPEETLVRWLARLRVQMPELTTISPDVLALHYRLRFDPSGLTPEERAVFRKEVDRWLEKGGAG